MNGFRSCAGNSAGRIRELEDIAKLLTQTPLDAIRLVLVQNARGLRLRDHWKIRNQILFGEQTIGFCPVRTFASATRSSVGAPGTLTKNNRQRGDLGIHDGSPTVFLRIRSFGLINPFFRIRICSAHRVQARIACRERFRRSNAHRQFPKSLPPPTNRRILKYL